MDGIHVLSVQAEILERLDPVLCLASTFRARLIAGVVAEAQPCVHAIDAHLVQRCLVLM